MSRVSIKDVAQACGVSPTAVSFALNRSREDCPLAETTQLNIIQQAKALGYRPNWRARSMRTRETHAIGLFYEAGLPLPDGVYYEIVAAFSATLRAKGYHLIFLPADQGTWHDAVHGGRLDGCVVSQRLPETLVEELRQSTLPAVGLNVTDAEGIASVWADDHNGAKLAMEHLYGLGHRDVVFFVDAHAEAHYSITARASGLTAFADTLKPGEMNVEQLTGTSQDIAERIAAKDRPTAVVCYSHAEAIPLIRSAHERGVRVPEDVSIICFNDVYPVDLLTPSLTAVAIPTKGIGEQGAELLLSLLAAKGDPSARNVAPSHGVGLAESLVIRESTGPAPRR